MLYSIHFLRFVAAAAVVLHHSLGDTPVDLGAAGVDVFFIISGIVICYSTRPDETPYEFGVRRFIRVMPLYWVATAGIVWMTWYCWRDLPDLARLLKSIFLFPLFGPGVDNLPLYFLA